MSSGTPALAIAVRPSKAGDIAAIAEIYGYHVLSGLASFELMAPSVDEMAKRRADVVGRNFPYLVAEADGRVVGFASPACTTAARPIATPSRIRFMCTRSTRAGASGSCCSRR